MIILSSVSQQMINMRSSHTFVPKRIQFFQPISQTLLQSRSYSINPQLQALSLHKTESQCALPLSSIFTHCTRYGHSRTYGKSNRIRAKKWRTYPPTAKSWVPQFEGAPQRKATVEQVLIKQPRKPNSGKRQVVKCRIKSNNRTLFAYIPFEKFALSKWNRVLLEGWSCSDVPFVHARCIRGKFDLPPPKIRGSCRKHSRKGKPGKKVDRLKNVRMVYYKFRSTLAPDIHSYMV